MKGEEKMQNVVEITDSDFEAEVINSGGITVVDFWAPWCGPCRKMGPILDEIAEEYKDKIKVVKINTDDNLKSATEYQISSLPSVFIFKNGEAKETMIGLMPKSAIVSNIQKYL